MTKVKWGKVADASSLKDDLRIYWTGWVMPEKSDIIVGKYIACVNGKVKRKNCYQVPLTSKILEESWEKEIKEARELMTEVCNYYEKHRKWPQ